MSDEQKRLADVFTRLAEIKKEKKFTVLVEISLTDSQIETMGKTILVFANTETNIKDYLMNKCHGNALLSTGRFATREEQPDFQTLVDFAFICLDAGLDFDDLEIDKNKVLHGY
ncbi:MAG TPA: hypothetical protein PLG30_14150 [Bacteroidia bacterium]|nr:hypothetical protein [Bacteroidia bacterium]